jgi:sulfate-transporting ATPase
MSQVPVYLLLSLPLVGAFAMFALGIVVIFQSSRVLNLAHGAMAMVPPYVLYELTRRGLPVAAGFPLAVVSGAAIGATVERLFVRNLRRQGPTGQTVGTVAALGVLVSLAVKIWGTTPRRAATILPDGGVSVGASQLSYGQMGLFAVAVIACAAMFLLFTRTPLGLAMRVAADNRRAASIVGIDADRTTTIAWMLGGALAAVAGVLLAAVTTLHPYNLSLLVLPGFVAALIGGLGSLQGALGGAAVVGLAQGMVPAIGLVPVVGSFARQLGAPQLVLTIVAFVVMYLRGTRFTGSDVRAEAGITSPASARTGERARRAVVPWALLAVAVLAWPLLDVPSSWLTEAGNASITTIVAVSLVLLTGWVGQVSLAHATFVGIGAFATAQLTERASLGFPLSLPVAAAVTAAIAAALGVVALRVRGLYLAVASLIFVWMSSEYLFAQSWLAGVGGSASIQPQRVGTPGAIPSFEFSDRRTFYYVAVAAAAAAVWGAANVRDSKTGRAFFAVRGSEMAAASLGIDVVRYKLLAFAVSGFLAGAAGNLLMVGKGAAQPSQFALNLSLFYVAVAVVGGLTSLGGAIAAAILFAFLDELFLRVSALAGWLEVVGAGLLAIALLVRPGGLASLAPAFRRIVAPLSAAAARLDGVAARVLAPARGTGERAGALASRFFRTLAERVRAPVRVEPLVVAEPPPPAAPAVERPLTPAVLSVDGLVVRFGGLTAVDGVAVQVREHEIVGLIGPNGAGKTTIFNAISGLNEPADGTITLFGRDVTRLPVHGRAALGMARTFQVIQLFPQISVFDNLLVATHLRNRSTLFGHLTVSRHSLLLEEAARHRVQQVIDLLGLHDVATRTVTGLPFGILRLVELARAAVTGARFIMLDEPASGLDTAETKRMIDLLRFVRDRLGATILLIEHDVPMVTAVSDHIYVVNRGRPLAQGRPSEIQQNEDVIAAYLGRPTVAV